MNLSKKEIIENFNKIKDHFNKNIKNKFYIDIFDSSESEQLIMFVDLSYLSNDKEFNEVTFEYCVYNILSNKLLKDTVSFNEDISINQFNQWISDWYKLI